MDNFNYTIPVTYTPEDNETLITKRNYLYKDCPVTANVECAKLWSFQKCGSDTDYSNPFVSGDVIYIQFPYDSQKYKKIICELIDVGTGAMIDPYGIVAYEYGNDAAGTSYVNILISTANITASCFYMNTHFFACTPNETAYNTCVSGKTGSGIPAYRAELECYQQLCSDSDEFIITSEPFRKVLCEKTIQITGYYPKYDCNRNYYAPFVGPVTNSFIPQIRVMGEIFWNNFGVEEEVVNGERTKAKRIDGYKMRTVKIPPYVTQMIAICFSAKNLFVSGFNGDVNETGQNLFKGHNAFQKNDDNGKMWIVQADLFIECPEQNFACE